MMVPPDIVAEIGKVVGLMRGEDVFEHEFDPFFQGSDLPYYKFGHPNSISNELLEMEQDSVLKYKKYPLIALKLDTAERISGGLVEYNLNIAILDYTDPDLLTENRFEKTIRPVLYPLYERFFEYLPQVGFFWDGSEDSEMPQHTRIIRPFWGIGELESSRFSGRQGTTAQIFNDPLDAIEIVDLKIKRNLVCLT